MEVWITPPGARAEVNPAVCVWKGAKLSQGQLLAPGQLYALLQNPSASQLVSFLMCRFQIDLLYS